MENIQLNVAALVDSAPRTVRVEYKGVFFTVRYISRRTLASIAEQCTILGYDGNTQRRIRKLDATKLVREIAKEIVVGWDNLTPRTLANLTPVKLADLSPEQQNMPIPFNLDNVAAVLSSANGLDDFLEGVATEASNFSAIPEEELEKNSESTPSGT